MGFLLPLLCFLAQRRGSVGTTRPLLGDGEGRRLSLQCGLPGLQGPWRGISLGSQLME